MKPLVPEDNRAMSPFPAIAEHDERAGQPGVPDIARQRTQRGHTAPQHRHPRGTQAVEHRIDPGRGLGERGGQRREIRTRHGRHARTTPPVRGADWTNRCPPTMTAPMGLPPRNEDLP